MKAFHFRLERVLSWRGTLLTLAEAKGEQLAGDLRATHEAKAGVVERQEAEHTAVLTAPTVSGAELRALEESRLWALREAERLAARAVALQQSIEAQQRHIAEARRGVKLVERLKERKQDNWNADAGREIDELAAESAIAQWRRLNHR